MSSVARDCLVWQFGTAWKLAQYHLEDLTTDECLWRPAAVGLHVHRGPDGLWHADWPDHEGYDLGPPSIAWLTWHIGYWWSTVIDRSFGNGELQRSDVAWPGSANAVRDCLNALEQRWRSALESLDDRQLRSSHRTRWPFADRPFGDVVAWLNLELMKNAAEIGYVRFLHGSGKSGGAAPVQVQGGNPGPSGLSVR